MDEKALKYRKGRLFFLRSVSPHTVTCIAFTPYGQVVHIYSMLKQFEGRWCVFVNQKV